MQLEDRRAEGILTAVHGMTDTLMEPVRDQIADLKMRLATEPERAGRTEVRAREADARATEFQQQLQTELIEHRRVIGTLADQLPARRSWRWLDRRKKASRIAAGALFRRSRWFDSPGTKMRLAATTLKARY